MAMAIGHQRSILKIKKSPAALIHAYVNPYMSKMTNLSGDSVPLRDKIDVIAGFIKRKDIL